MDPSDRNSRVVARVASELEAEGYEVTLEPSPSSLPTWLAPFRPDAIARKGDEQVVVEVLERGGSFHGSDQFQRLSRQIQDQPGWGLRVAIVQSSSPSAPQADQIAEQVTNVESLLDSGHRGAALLVAWAAAEGALRLLLTRSGIEPRSPSSSGLLREAYGADLLSDRQFELLDSSAEVRNRLAHGLDFEVDIDDDTIRRLGHLANTLSADSFTPVAEMVDWFFSNYEDPANSLPYDSREGGYQWLGLGPHDAEDVLRNRYDTALDEDIQEAVETIETDGVEWARIEFPEEPD